MDSFRLKFSLVFLFITQLAFSQLSNFTLTVTHEDETCPNNGKLFFNVSNTTPGSTIIYSIYLLPNTTTPISVQSANSLSGLNSGTYRVVATQSLGGDSGSQQQDIIIEDSVETLTYQLTSTNEICGYDGTITVTTTTGNGPFSYEIIAGPVTAPQQSSNVFTGLTTGTYQIRVRDICNEGVVQTYFLEYSNPALDLELNNPALASCTMVRVSFDIDTVFPYPDGVIKYPLQVTTTVNPPTGPPITYTQTITNGVVFSQLVPFYTAQPYSYSFTITDGCGIVYTLNGVINNLSVAANYQLLPDDCTHKLVRFFNVAAVTLVSAPSAFSTSLPISYTSQIINNSVAIGQLVAGTYVFNTVDICGVAQVFTIEVIITPPPPPFHLVYNVNCTNGSVLIYDISAITMVSGPANYPIPLPHNYTSSINSSNYIGFDQIPNGTYVFNVLDLCGEPHTIVVVVAPPPLTPVLAILEGCQDGFGSIKLSSQFQSVSMTIAPTAYGFPLPHNLMSSVIQPAGNTLVLDSLPPGNYTIRSIDLCGTISNTSFTILGHQDLTNIVVSPNCGSFDLNLNNTSNNTGITSYWLQELNTVTNTWGHPATGVAYIDGTYPNGVNSVSLNNNDINYNLAYQGHFRVLKVFTSFVSGSNDVSECYKSIYEFDYNGLPQITDVYSISCGGTFEVVVIANGFDPLIYRITTRDGFPFVVQNGNSNVFTGLLPATYNFQVEDACGNLLNSSYEILNPNPLVITANPITCDGENLTLSVPNFPFFQYQWWKNNNTATILSTSSTLSFTPFNSAANNGTYHVQITYSNSQTSCLNQVLDYTIILDNTPPEAGQGNNLSYCGRQGSIDLFTLLQGTYDTGGTWTEVSGSGMLAGSIWNSTNVAFGTYQFKYRVDGTCSLFDESIINIVIKAIPTVPTASADAIVCDSGSLHLYATNVTPATYQWTGPNSFTSTDQNPVINNISANNNGTYTVYATQNGCQSGSSSVEIVVNALPQFTLSQDCIDAAYVVTATPNDTTASYSWTGPDNFTSAQNPILITGGEVGLYNLTVTDASGCAVTQSIEVIRTICFIPNVITPNDDATNDAFNLTGFDVDKIEIYNRWGRKVYEKNNYTNEWHGQNMKGERLPDSTYYYILNFRTGENKAGWVFVSSGL